MMAKKRTKLKKIILAYVTTKNKKEALTIGETLVKKQLAACINIIPLMISSYRWQGKIERGNEAVLIIKTLRSKRKAIIKEVKRLHSYSVPCILFLNIDGGNPDYMGWLNQEVT